jgi:hypothetical protein
MIDNPQQYRVARLAPPKGNGMHLNTAQGAIQAYNEKLAESVVEAFRTLLEEKHLYQSVVLDDDAVRNALLPRIELGIQGRLSQTGSLAHGAAKSPWILSHDQVAVGGAEGSTFLHLSLTHAKLFCKTCDRLEAFNLETARSTVETTKMHASAEDRQKGYVNSGKYEQVYVLSYLCQSCKTFPEVFLVRRSEGKLTLSGRSPMEHVPVPPEIPKEVSRFYSGAVVAYQCGQTLAGLFMLRTLCEQWAQRFAAPGDYADQAINKYMDSLPEDFKTRFPSLRSIYEKLSADIHAATGSDELYVQMATEIAEHFAARKVFKLTTPT